MIIEVEILTPGCKFMWYHEFIEPPMAMGLGTMLLLTSSYMWMYW